MKGLNLSEWAIRHRPLIIFFMIIVVITGGFSYANLGREEDPSFAVGTMVVSAGWPGATLVDTMNEVTNTIEEKLEETPNLNVLRSYVTPGKSVTYVDLKDSTPASEVPDAWYQVRKKVSDIESQLPSGVVGPYFNDEFGDVYGIIYGITFDGFSWRQARDFAETAKAAFLSATDVGKVTIFGQQDEKYYLNFSPQQLAALDLNVAQVLQAIANQNTVTPAGVITTKNDEILIEVSGELTDIQSLQSINLYVGGQFYKLTELAKITHGYVDPPTKGFVVNGKPAIGIGVSMSAGGNNLVFGDSLSAVASTLQQQFPIGIDLVQVSDQPDVVRKAIGGFTDALYEAVAIVLVISFLSLGLRAGLVVAISIPMVLAIVFLAMDYLGITLQRISLGALVISLGLLVDDAMITIESMVSRIEAGVAKIEAASYAYVSTAFPMLTGTLVTIAGFLPIGLAKSSVGQYTISLFQVVGIALVSSWFVAVIFSPVVGMTVLPDKIKEKKTKGPGRVMRTFIRMLTFCMRHHYLTIAVTVALFVMALFGQNYVQREFFPASDRPELLVTLILPSSSSIYATAAAVKDVEKLIEGDQDVASYSAYVGGGAVRFYLPLDVQGDNDFIAQMVIVGKDLDARDRLQDKLTAALEANHDLTGRVARLELGPPVGWPVQYRISATTLDATRAIAEKVANAIRTSGDAVLVNFNWMEKAKTVRLNVNQNRARQLGLSSKAISNQLYAVLNGAEVTQIRDSIYLVDVVGRAANIDKLSLETLRQLQLNLPSGASVPLSDVADIDYTIDESFIWRRDRLPTITVQAAPAPGLEAPTVAKLLEPVIAGIEKTLPAGAKIEIGGTEEKSGQSTASVLAVVPLMLSVILIILMIQLQSFSRLFLVLSVAPLGLIGIVVAMLTTHTPLGFVAILGVIALTGMIVRNSVILVDRIEYNHGQGMETWEAVLEATEHRMRPILLTASAAILGMIPIMSDVFWGPMAYAISGGLAGATALTLLFLPALYVVWFRVKPPDPNAPPATAPQRA